MKMIPLRRMFSDVVGGSWGAEPGTNELDIPCIRGTDFDSKAGRPDISNAPLRSYSRAEAAGRAVRRGDLIIEKSGGGEQQPVGRCVLYDADTIAIPTNFAGRLRPRSDVNPRFTFYVMASLYSDGRTRACIKQTTGIQNLDLNWLLTTRVPAPATMEQRAIADYLDRETARIDALIAAKQRMIELLGERWSRSLDEWIWGDPSAPIVSLRRACVLIRDGTHQPPERVPDGYPLLSVRNLVDGELVLREDDTMIGASDYQLLARALSPHVDDVALAIVGATLGKTALVRELPPFALQRSVAILRCDRERMLPLFLKLVLDSPRSQALLRSRVAFSAQPGIYLADLAELPVPAPPLSHQQLVAAEATSAWRVHQRVVAGLGAQISRLTERRQALITGAVTGGLEIPAVAV